MELSRIIPNDTLRRLNPHLFGTRNAECGARNGVVREASLHEEIFSECRRRGWIALHGSMAERTCRTLGEPDFVILAGGGRVLFVECKTRTGKLSPAQAALKHHAEKLGQASYPVLDAPMIAIRDPNPDDGNSFRAVLLFGQVLLVSRTSELPLSQRLLVGVNEDGSRGIAWYRTIVERDANTVTITPTVAQRTALEAVSNQLTALGYGAVELELKRAANGNLVLMDFEDGNRVGGRWANEQTGFLDRFAAAVVAKANAG